MQVLIHKKLYDSKDLIRISFGGYVRKLVYDFTASYGIEPGKIRLRAKIDFNRDLIPVDEAVPVVSS